MKRGTFGCPNVSLLLLIVCIRHVEVPFEVDSETMSSIPGYDAALSAALLLVPAASPVRFPWERGKVMQQLFGDDSAPEIKRPRLNIAGPPVNVTCTAGASNDSASASSQFQKELRLHVPRIRPSTMHLSVTEPELDRQKALDAWLQVLKIDLRYSIAGRQIIRIVDSGVDSEEQNREVNATITLSSRGKSANTLKQRALALAPYLTWATRNTGQALPIDEIALFAYLRTEDMQAKGATNGTRLLEALCFAHGVFGLDGALHAATSSRVKGKALDLHLKKAPRAPATELSDLQVYALEACLSDKTCSPDDHLAAGTLLWMTYCRNRASDIYRLRSIEVERSETNSDIGFVEATCQGAKNAKSLMLKLELMPVVGPIAGLGIASFGAWYDRYAEARAKVGLEPLDLFAAVNSDARIVLFPKRTTEGNLSNLPATPDDMSIALRFILSRYGWNSADTSSISSHSCKATMLSMAAKRGTLDEPERKILGYHLERGSGTVKAYSRDVMSVPLRKLNSLIREVAAGYFLPSSNRSGRFPSDEDDPQVLIADRFAKHLHTVFPDCPSPQLGFGNSEDACSEQDDIISLISDDGFGNQKSDTALEKSKANCGDELGLAPGSQLNIDALRSQSSKPDTASGGSSSSSSDSDSESESAVLEKLAGACDLQAHPAVEDLWKVKGGSYHIGSSKSEVHFRCGTKIGYSATRIIMSPKFMSPRCKQCFP
jgi:hypothetical protein